MKKILLIVLGVIVVAAVLVSILRPRNKAEATVETGRVERLDLTAMVNCSGTIQPKRKVDISANAMGTIVELAVVEGQRVTTGDLLLKIDPSEYSAAVQALEATIASARADLRLAEASLEKAVLDLERSEKLFAEGLAAEEALTAARTNRRVEAARVEAARHRIDQYRANLSSAQHDLKQVTIIAPMSGIVTRLNVEEGENAIMGTLNNPGTVLLVISDLSTMEAWVEVDETEVVKLELGQRAEVTIDAFPDRTFVGRVTEIGNSPVRVSTGASREAVDFEVKVELDETVPGIRPGLTAKAEITVAQRDGALAVPLGAVTVRDWPLQDSDIRRYSGKRAREQEEALADLGFTSRSSRPERGGDDDAEADDGENSTADATGAAETAEEEIERKETEGVFVIRDDFVKFVPVTIGVAGEDHFEVLEGLDEDETIVAGPFRILRELKDGARIKQKSADRGRRGES